MNIDDFIRFSPERLEPPEYSESSEDDSKTDLYAIPDCPEHPLDADLPYWTARLNSLREELHEVRTLGYSPWDADRRQAKINQLIDDITEGVLEVALLLDPFGKQYAVLRPVPPAGEPWFDIDDDAPETIPLPAPAIPSAKSA